MRNCRAFIYGTPSIILTASVLVLICSLPLTASYAGSATWKLNPTNGDWNTASNWTPRTVPDEETDVATFGVSNVTDVSLSAFVQIGGIVFDAGGSGYTINIYLRFAGAGIMNNSGVIQNLVPSPNIAFTGNSTAGNDMIFTTNGSATSGVFNQFFDNSNAGSATFIQNGALPGNFGAKTFFHDNSSAANSTIINNGPNAGQAAGETEFSETSSAGNSTIANYSGGFTVFEESSTAANATLSADGSSIIYFSSKSDGGLAPVTLSNSATLELSTHLQSLLLTIGSVEGDGALYLGKNHLAIGSNGLNTTFSGVIQDGGIRHGTLGTLTKVGSGTLTLSGANTYTGGTTVEAGILLVKTTNGSATGTGAVQINGGTLGGRSNITGAVTVGSGSGTGAFLAPGVNGPGTLSIHNTLTFKADGTYNCDLNTANAKADQVAAKGVTIENGAHFAFAGKGNQTLPPGTVFTVINNKSHQPIVGLFANLADDSTFTANGNNFHVSYEGGDGNDLTFTVEP